MGCCTELDTHGVGEMRGLRTPMAKRGGADPIASWGQEKGNSEAPRSKRKAEARRNWSSQWLALAGRWCQVTD